MISYYSGKPIFGQDGPVFVRRPQQTICGDPSQNVQTTAHISLYLLTNPQQLVGNVSKACASVCVRGISYRYSVPDLGKAVLNVKTFELACNPQITNARINLYSWTDLIASSSPSSMLVGISEAIRLLLFRAPMRNTKPQGKPTSYSTLSKHGPPGLRRRHPWLEDVQGDARPPAGTVSPCRVPTAGTDQKDQGIDLVFSQWLAGLIDGDGCFLLTKKGYASLEIVLALRDKHALFQIKQKFGGSVKLRSGVNWLRYRMHHKEGMIRVIQAVNGEIRNPIRALQLKNICDKYNIPFISAKPLTKYNGWLSGFFDSDGSIYFSLTSSLRSGTTQLFVACSQLNSYILDPLVSLYGGVVYPQKNSFKWTVYRKKEILDLLDYFKACPPRTAKHHRLKLIPRYFELRKAKAHLAPENSVLGKAWKNFLAQWERYESKE